MSAPEDCPDISAWRELLDGTVPEDRQDDLARHVESCADCRATLEGLAGGMTLPFAPARHGESDSPVPDPALQELLGNLKKEKPPAAAARDYLASSVMSLGFLPPSEDPSHLGRLGNYEITGIIGRGATGVVLKGVDVRLSRVVAIKILAQHLAADPVARQRFLGEAQKMAAVAHDHVVTIHAVDEVAGLPYLVMEYIVGVSLEDRILRTGSLKVVEILRIGMQAATGLAAAHAQGLVHRDIKPSNILLENGVERVKITDFGLAQAFADAQPTGSGPIAGTPQYMSPEQARGEPLDHRSDLFSLGCVLYAMCTGRSPFRAETPIGAMHRVCHDTPRPVREINPEIPEWLAEVIGRLLAKNREDRIQSASEVAQLLGGYLAHVQQPSQAPPSTAPQPLAEPRHKTAAGPEWLGIGLVAGLTLVLLGLIVWRFWPDALKSNDGGSGPSPGAVDIQPWANIALTQCPEQHVPGNNLGQLQPGVLTVDGVSIEVGPQYIQLSGGDVLGFPEAVRGIRVNRQAAKLHFLHGCVFPILGQTTGIYTIRYVDGSQEVVPIVEGRHVRDWWRRRSLPERATRAKVAWTGSNAATAKSNATLQVFLCTWENPHPEKGIATIDFERGAHPWPAPFLLAVTCDDDPTPLPPEPGLVGVNIPDWSDFFSVSISGCAASPIGGKGKQDVLAAPGRHDVELRHGDVVFRRGTMVIAAGEPSSIDPQTVQELFPLKEPQPAPAAELTGQAGGAWSVAVSEDGKTMATGAGNGTVTLWKAQGAGWTRFKVLEAHSSTVRSVVFSPKGELLATASDGDAARLWEVNSGRLVKTLKDGQCSVFSLAFSRDGATLASGNGDGSVDLWDVPSRRCLDTLKCHDHLVHCVAFSPDGKRLATGAWDETVVKLWDVASRTQRHVMKGHGGSVTSVVFSPDGRTLASASSDSTVRLWNVETGQVEQRRETPAALFAVAFSRDGRRLAAAGQFATVRIWDAPSWRLAHDFHAHWAEIRALQFSSDDRVLVTASLDHAARIWTLADLPKPPARTEGPEPRRTLRPWDSSGDCLALAPDGRRLAGAPMWGGDVAVWSLDDFSLVARLRVNESEESKPAFMLGPALAFDPRGATLITCTDQEGHVRLWDTASLAQRLVLPRLAAGATTVAISPDGSRLATANWQKEDFVRFWDLSSGKELKPYKSLHGRPWAAAFSPDGQRLAVAARTGNGMGNVLLVDLSATDQPPLVRRHGSCWMGGIVFSPNGKLLATTGTDKLVKLWDAATLEPLATLEGHRECVFWAAFSRDGKILATAGGATIGENVPWRHDGEVCLWDAEKRQMLNRFRPHQGAVACAIFTADDETLLTTGRDGKIHFWDVAELLNYGTEKAGKSGQTLSK